MQVSTFFDANSLKPEFAGFAGFKLREFRLQTTWIVCERFFNLIMMHFLLNHNLFAVHDVEALGQLGMNPATRKIVHICLSIWNHEF